MTRLDARPTLISLNHFPRRPSFPATLLLDSAIRGPRTRSLATARLRGRWRLTRMTYLKMRDFVLPGQSLALMAELQRRRTRQHAGLTAGLASERWRPLASSLKRQENRDEARPRRLPASALDTCRQRCRLYLGRLARRSQRRRDDHPVRRQRLRQIAAEVKGFDAASVIDDRKMLKFANCSHGRALAAAEQAIHDAGVRPTPATARRWALPVGTGMMGVPFSELAEVHALRARWRVRCTAPARRCFGERPNGILSQPVS